MMYAVDSQQQRYMQYGATTCKVPATKGLWILQLLGLSCISEEYLASPPMVCRALVVLFSLMTFACTDLNVCYGVLELYNRRQAVCWVASEYLLAECSRVSTGTVQFPCLLLELFWVLVDDERSTVCLAP
jgi:hypothetical protein